MYERTHTHTQLTRYKRLHNKLDEPHLHIVQVRCLSIKSRTDVQAQLTLLVTLREEFVHYQVCPLGTDVEWFEWVRYIRAMQYQFHHKQAVIGIRAQTLHGLRLARVELHDALAVQIVEQLGLLHLIEVMYHVCP